MWNTMDFSTAEILVERQHREASAGADHRALAGMVGPRAARARRARLAVFERLAS